MGRFTIAPDKTGRNLELLTRGQHLAEHRPEFEAKRARNAAKARWG